MGNAGWEIENLINSQFSILNSPFLTEGQESKGVRWMPWHQESKKDVVSCDKLRGAVSRRRSGDFRMGQPRRSNIRLPYTEQNRYTETTRGTETSKYPEEKKETSIP